ncbi:MAG: 3-phosphoshikimate 1-carboxyvinyltransferase [Bacteroidales bacterium]
MDIKLTAPSAIEAEITLPFSKSISNRVLLINRLCNNNIPVQNIAVCDDTRIMLEATTSHNTYLDTGSAGTATRFVAALLTLLDGRHTLTGSERMKQRPIGVLVDSLRSLGANIRYSEHEGFLPLEIDGGHLRGGEIDVSGSISSQYISALLMIAPYTNQGVKLTLTGKIISRPYINMTLSLMKRYGVEAVVGDNIITVPAMKYNHIPYTIEADWSAASYWYGFVALADAADIILDGLDCDSLQGDSNVASLFAPLGVATEYNDGYIRLRKCNAACGLYEADLTDTPDLAQTMVVVAALKGFRFRLSGLQSLKIKETDRIAALVCEMKKLGYILDDSVDGVLSWDGYRGDVCRKPQISTYDDHRMAMAFSMASFVVPEIRICDAEVVSKSYPQFWKDLSQVGFIIEKQ